MSHLCSVKCLFIKVVAFFITNKEVTMLWFVITVLVIAILVINDKFNNTRRVIDENDTRYGRRFTDIEVRIAKIESKIKD